MRYIEENDLKNQFWKNYGYRKDFLKDNPSIGCISVAFEGRWRIFHRAAAKTDDQIRLNQAIIKLCCHQY